MFIGEGESNMDFCQPLESGTLELELDDAKLSFVCDSFQRSVEAC
jgi:hypothetical protein